MSFSLSGSTITQIGTDTDVSGLSGIAGVVLYSIQGRTVYNVGNRKIIVKGTLSQDNRVEEIWFGSSAPTPTVEITTGTYSIGKILLYDGQETYTVGSPFTFTKTGGMSYKDYDSNIICRASGTLNLYGCSILMAGERAIWYEIGSHGVIRETYLYKKDTSGYGPRAYMLSANTDVNGFYVYEFNAVNFNSAMVQFKNYIPYDVRLPFFYNGANNAGKTLYVENFERYGNWSGDQQGQGACKYIYQNKVEGATTLEVYCRGRTNDNDFVVELRKDILINSIDDTGAKLPGVKFYSRDVNNGHRIDFWAGTPATDTVYVSDRTYAFTTDVDGIGVNQDYLAAASVANNIGSYYNYLSDPRHPMIVDDRGEKSTIMVNGKLMPSVAKFNGIKYGKRIATVSIELAGPDRKEISWTLFDDDLITDTRTNVTNYTTIETPKKFYNRALTFLEDNYLGEKKPIVTRSGDVLEGGTYNIVIDKTAPIDFAFDGSTITVKADTFIGGINTAGTVTLLNGATIQAGTYDCDIYVNTGYEAALIFSNITLTGLVYNNDSAHKLTINLAGLSTVTAGDAGTGNGETSVISTANVKLIGIIDNSEVRLYSEDLNTEIFGLENSTGEVNIVYTGTYLNAVLVIFNTAYEPKRIVVDLTGVDSSLAIQQSIDRTYNNPL